VGEELGKVLYIDRHRREREREMRENGVVNDC
jgi:hypothetical protein